MDGGNMDCETHSGKMEVRDSEEENMFKRGCDGLLKLKSILLACFSAFVYVIVCGMVTAYTAPATVDMKKPGSRLRDITLDQITWIASLTNISSGVANIAGGYLTHRFGRKSVILCISLPFIMGWLMITYASTVYWIYLARLIQGFCYGCCAVAVPAYIVEIAPTHIRGLLCSIFQVAYSTGILLTMSLGGVLRWSWLAATVAAILTIATCIMFFMPESPSWLLINARRPEASEAIQFLLGKDADVDKEIEAQLDNMTSQVHTIGWRDILEPELYKPVIISSALMFFIKASGYATLMSYTVDIFMNIGSSIDPQTSAELIAWVQLVVNVLSSMIIEKFERRTLFIWSGALATFSLGLIGTYAILPEFQVDVSRVDWIPVAGLILYMATFSFGFGSIPMVIIPEMAPTKSRSLVLAIAFLSNSISSFVVTKTYGVITENIGYFGLFWIYGSFTLLGAFFGWIFLPETRGKTISDINKSFARYQNLNLADID